MAQRDYPSTPTQRDTAQRHALRRGSSSPTVQDWERIDAAVRRRAGRASYTRVPD